MDINRIPHYFKRYYSFYSLHAETKYNNMNTLHNSFLAIKKCLVKKKNKNLFVHNIELIRSEYEKKT